MSRTNPYKMGKKGTAKPGKPGNSDRKVAMENKSQDLDEDSPNVLGQENERCNQMSSEDQPTKNRKNSLEARKDVKDEGSSLNVPQITGLGDNPNLQNVPSHIPVPSEKTGNDKVNSNDADGLRQRNVNVSQTGNDKKENGSSSQDAFKDSDRGHVFQVLKCVGVVLVLLLVGFAVCVDNTKYKNSISDEDISSLTPQEHFKTQLSQMKQQFTNQTPRFWKLLRNPTSVHLNNTSPQKPLVIMLAAPPSAHNVIGCFARKLASAIDPKFDNAFDNTFEIHGKELKEQDGDKAKKIIDDTLKDHFGQGNKVALLYNLELFPVPSPLLFYAYCDDQNAPFKHVSVIFTVNLPGPVPAEKTAVEQESAVNDFLLNQVWADNPDVYGEDRIAALLSRITDTVALIRDEKDAENMCLQ